MTVFVFAGLIPANRLRSAGAHQIFHDMTDLPRLIRGGKTEI